MSLPSLIGDRLAPSWQALTPAQRLCWHFWAAAHPQTVDDLDYMILIGWQAYIERNASLMLPDTAMPLTEPPAATTPPARVAILTMSWPRQSRVAVTGTSRYGYTFVQLTDAMPANQIAIVHQGYSRQRKDPKKTTGVRHVTVLLPLDTGPVSLLVPTGYFASTAGATKFARIKGRTARRRPDQPLGKLRVVNTDTGETIQQILSNPNGGGRKRIKRPRHYP